MKLYHVKHSPFARKVRILSNVLGIQNKIELINMDVFNAPSSYKKINPLIKVPALEMVNGEMLTNSPFICQYLAQTTPGGQKVFPMGPELWTALNIQSIADGGAEAAVARRWEMQLRSPDKFDSKIDRRHKDKIENALEYFEQSLFMFSKSEMTIKEISLICFVDYLNFRFPHEKMENQYPQTFAWVKKWNENPMVNEQGL